MGTLDRISMIVKSNVNAMLEKAENPERELNYFILEMGDSIKQAEIEVQNALVQAKFLENQSNEARRKGQDWESKAERALKANREDLAREALRLKAQADEEATNYQSQYDMQMVQQKALQEQLKLLKQKYDQVQKDKTNLLARYQMARLTNKVFGEKDPGTGLNTGDYARMERKIMASEAENTLDDRAAKAAQTEAEINNLPSDDLDAELAALKAKMNLGKKEDTPAGEGNPGQ